MAKMGYKKARSIGKKSLLSLIAENKFERGKSVSSSIGLAASDKFKAFGTRAKEKFDPLNMVKSVFGEGIVGRSLVTLAGRAVGRSEEDIGYFGGYKRKYRNKKKKGNPLITKINAGENRPLRLGDSLADIMAKLYNFMKKAEDQIKIERELEVAFREGQEEKEELRHKKLLKAIKDFTGKKGIASIESATEKSWIDDLIDTLKNWKNLLIAGLFAALELFGPNIPLPRSRPPKAKPGESKLAEEKSKSATEPKPGESKLGEEPKPSEQPKTKDMSGKKGGNSNKPTEKISDRSKARNSTATKAPTATPEVPTASKLSKVLKVTNEVAAKTLSGLIKALDKIVSVVPGGYRTLGGAAIIYDLRNDIANLLKGLNAGELSGDQAIHDGERILAKFLGGMGGMELGALLGGTIGTSVGGPWGTVVGAVSGGGLAYISSGYGQQLAEALFDYFMDGKIPQINRSGANDIETDIMGTPLMSSPTIVPNSANPPVPKKETPKTSDVNSGSTQVASVTKNVVNGSSETIDITPINPRIDNDSINWALRNSTVIV